MLAIYSPKLFETDALKIFKFKNVYVLTHPFAYDFMHATQTRPSQAMKMKQRDTYMYLLPRMSIVELHTRLDPSLINQSTSGTNLILEFFNYRPIFFSFDNPTGEVTGCEDRCVSL